jgi:hypothetical protein
MPVDGEAGGLAVVDHVVPGELRDTADQHPEQQNECSPDPQVQWDGLVGEAPVELLDVVAFSQKPRRFLARGKRHRQFAGQAAGPAPDPARLRCALARTPR